MAAFVSYCAACPICSNTQCATKVSVTFVKQGKECGERVNRLFKSNCGFSNFSMNSQAIPRIPILPPMIPVYYVPVPQTKNPAASSPLQEKLSPPQSMQPPQSNPYSMYLFWINELSREYF